VTILEVLLTCESTVLSECSVVKSTEPGCGEPTLHSHVHQWRRHWGRDAKNL